MQGWLSSQLQSAQPGASHPAMPTAQRLDSCCPHQTRTACSAPLLQVDDMFVIWRPWAAYISPYYHVVRLGRFSLHRTSCHSALEHGHNAWLACLDATVGATLAHTSAHAVCADQCVGPQRLLPHAHGVRGQGRNLCELGGQGAALRTPALAWDVVS